MTTDVAPPGWHPDPSNPGGALRWWDGIAWTHHTQQTAPPLGPVAPVQPAPGFPPTGYSATGYSAAGFQATGYSAAGSYPTYGQPQQRSFSKQNSLSLTAVGVVALYIVIALSTHIVFLGIFPAILCIRALNRKESLAPLAVAAAVVAIGVAILALK